MNESELRELRHEVMDGMRPPQTASRRRFNKGWDAGFVAARDAIVRLIDDKATESPSEKNRR